MITKFVLASSSPRRKDLLKDIGAIPDAIVSTEIDETPKKGELPKIYVQRVAMEKLEAALLNGKCEGALVMAADTVVACGRRILRKADTKEDVAKCLRLLSGRRHRVYTAIAACSSSGAVLRRLNESTVVFRRLSDEEINKYAACGEGLGKAGGYAIQGKAASYIRFISGSYSGIVGLPLHEAYNIIKASGYEI